MNQYRPWIAVHIDNEIHACLLDTGYSHDILYVQKLSCENPIEMKTNEMFRSNNQLKTCRKGPLEIKMGSNMVSIPKYYEQIETGINQYKGVLVLGLKTLIDYQTKFKFDKTGIQMFLQLTANESKQGPKYSPKITFPDMPSDPVDDWEFTEFNQVSYATKLSKAYIALGFFPDKIAMTIIDTGAVESFISIPMLEKIGLAKDQFKLLDKQTTAASGDGTLDIKYDRNVIPFKFIDIDRKMASRAIAYYFRLIDGNWPFIILGTELLGQFSINIQFGAKNMFSFEGNKYNIKIE